MVDLHFQELKLASQLASLCMKNQLQPTRLTSPPPPLKACYSSLSPSLSDIDLAQSRQDPWRFGEVRSHQDLDEIWLVLDRICQNLARSHNCYYSFSFKQSRCRPHELKLTRPVISSNQWRVSFTVTQSCQGRF